MSRVTEKNKFISAYVDKEKYDMFQVICQEQGLPCNKVINILIRDYIKKNEIYLPEQNNNIQKII